MHDKPKSKWGLENKFYYQKEKKERMKTLKSNILISLHYLRHVGCCSDTDAFEDGRTKRRDFNRFVLIQRGTLIQYVCQMNTVLSHNVQIMSFSSSEVSVISCKELYLLPILLLQASLLNSFITGEEIETWCLIQHSISSFSPFFFLFFYLFFFSRFPPLVITLACLSVTCMS